ncbi:transglutaminase domain-containing protein [uncultured Mycobacterium sp.]|uniref:transglutaminase domain-containing protein n=1 Tax=uncultured Mycobacterium sp. TaxID=171292 RepID=UPI0035CC5E80
MNAPSEIAHLVRALERFKCMPTRWAAYDMDPHAAANMLRCTPDEVLSLTEYGLSSSQTADGPCFDYFDVMNVGRYSSSGMTVPERNATTLLRFSRQPSSTWLGPQRWKLKVHLPDAGRFGSCTVRIPDFTSAGVTYFDGSIQWPTDDRVERSGGYVIDVGIDGVYDPVASPVVQDIYEDILHQLRSGEIIHQAISEPLRAEHWLAWRMGIADCMVISRVMADRLRGAGVQARARRGFILGLVGSDHAWCEVHEDGRWKTIDVGLAAMPTGLSGGRRLPSHDEFASHCLGGRFNRLLPCVADDASALMHDAQQRPLPMIGIVSATTR